MAKHYKTLSRQRSDTCYLSIVHIGQGARDPPPPKPKAEEFSMSIHMNRLLDTLASIASVALGLALAGATAAVGV